MLTSAVNLTTKPCFENANCRFYQEPIAKVAKMKRISTSKQRDLETFRLNKA